MDDTDMILTPSAMDNPSIAELRGQRDNFKYNVGGQREYVWDYKRKCELIFSLLKNIKTGIITVNVNGEDMEVADGQQRLNTVFSFLNNEFALSDKTLKLKNPDGTITSYNLKGLKFKDFPRDLEISFLSRIMRIEKYFGLTENQLNEIMIMLNNGKPLTKIERAMMENFGSTYNFIEQIKQSDLFERKKIRITNSNALKQLDNQLIISIIGNYLGIDDDISLNNSYLISKKIKDNNLLTDAVRNEISETFDYMDSIIPAPRKYLTRINAISVFKLCREIKDTKVEKRTAIGIIDNFYKDLDSEEYDDTGNIVKAKIENNFCILKKYYDECISQLSHEELA